MRHTTPNDPYIIYGRGGAGNIHHRSTIRTAWRKLSTASETGAQLSPATSPETYYAHSKACSVRSGRSGSESGSSEASGSAGSLKSGKSGEGRVKRLMGMLRGE